MKKSLRTSVLAMRDMLGIEERCQKSTLIKEMLFGLNEFHSSSNILFYVATKSEVQTEDMIRQAIKQGKRALVPITDAENKRLLISELHDFDLELEKGAYGILEPTKIYQRLVPLDEVEMIIVPGVVFDLHGHRIGYGGGYYDRMLESIGQNKGTKACLIGVCFECQLVDTIPIEKHDMPVSRIITEERVIMWRRDI
ncbi:5-formyltetrahydrofolate cyclo-ligase [Candidatus Desantisbacteria bacterium CG2_30_40_21]|nr:MAG: 5-formyltetrahydrofolate cyclo-ligase [Candidatus Desantisbacteria bacterium CG2_30_40_21]